MARYLVDLSASLAHHAAPPLLRAFGEWLARQQRGAVGWFDALVLEPVLASWNEEAADRLSRAASCFLSLPDGSSLALLTHDEAAPPAVVLLGSEGEARTIASSLEEFLIALAAGETGVFELDDEDAGSGRADLRSWLGERGVEEPPAKDIDFQAWLDDEGPEKPMSSSDIRPVVMTDAMKALPPKLAELARFVGSRCDDPRFIELAKNGLGAKKVSESMTAGGSAGVTSKKLGVEITCAHEVVHEAYAVLQKTKRTFVPYVSMIDVSRPWNDLPEGLTWEDSVDDVTRKLGAPTLVPMFMSDDDENLVPTWKRVLDPVRGIVLTVEIRRGLRLRLCIDEAAVLAPRNDGAFSLASVGVFLGWALKRRLIDESHPDFTAHDALLRATRERKAKPSALVHAALSRGLWDSHLVDPPGEKSLRRLAYQAFYAMNDVDLSATLQTVFGARENEHGDDEPVLDDDTWQAIDEATPALDAIFARWVK